MNGKKFFSYSSLAMGVALAINTAPVLANNPVTPIEHVIVVIGENVTFDTLYGAYVPLKGQTVKNLLSQGIIKADGTPGPHFIQAKQREGSLPRGEYSVNPSRGDFYTSLPQPLEIGILNPQTFSFAGGTPDSRFPADLASGPFQITKYAPYGSANSATGDPVHRFFQMWQQTGGSNANHSLFTWVATNAGTGGDNGATGPVPGAAQQGGELMGFYNMAQGDAPYFHELAKLYALSDNYHQAIMGGTGANFFSIATADVAVYNKAGKLAVPPANQIENPNPQAGTDNFYTRDGYSGGSYVNCSNPFQPGVNAVLKILKGLNRASNCEKNAYYLVNNYDIPYNLDGTAKSLGADQYVFPPQTVPTIGEALSSNNVSWNWYTAGVDANDILNDPFYPYVRAAVDAQVPTYIPEPYRTQTVNAYTFKQTQSVVYNALGNPLLASSNVATNPELHSHLKGVDSFMNDVTNKTLPAVSFVVPKNLSSGHPGYSAPVSYEAFIKQLITKVKSQPKLWANTAIIITTDEGGGYFDTGAIQNVDFFGDGPRIPMLVVSPYAKKGYVDHVYHDHASILKFIEYNWGISPLSARSRDNLPNPVSDGSSYLPTNQPAVGDLTSLFNFTTK